MKTEMKTPARMHGKVAFSLGTEAKAPQRDQLARDVEAYRAQGGNVQRLPQGAASRPLRSITE